MKEFEFLLFNIDGSHHILVLEVWWNAEALAEDIELAVTANKPDQMVATRLRFFQRRLRSRLRGREAQWFVAQLR